MAVKTSALPLRGIFLTIFFVFTEAIQTACPPGWLPWQDSCYILLRQKMTWSEGFRACDRPGTNMIIPTTEGQHNFIWRTMTPLMTDLDAVKMELWIGCKDNDHDAEVECFSRSGFITNYTNWANDKVLNRGEDCIKMSEKYDGKWGDDECSLHKFVACEMRVPHPVYCLTADNGRRFTPQCLLNHDIKNLTAKGVIGCGQACWAEPRCHSFNLWQLGKICQLNYASRLEADVTDFISVDGCSHFSL